MVSFSKPINPLSVTAFAIRIVDLNTKLQNFRDGVGGGKRLERHVYPSEPLLPNTYYSFCFDANYYTKLRGCLWLHRRGWEPRFRRRTAFTTGTSSFHHVPDGGQYQSAQQYNNNRSAKCVYSSCHQRTGGSADSGQSAITLTPSVAGTVTLASDQVTLQFAPSANLAADTTYMINVSGFKDVNGIQ